MSLLRRRQQQQTETAVLENYSTAVVKEHTKEAITDWMDKSTESTAYEHGINSFDADWLPKTGSMEKTPSNDFYPTNPSSMIPISSKKPETKKTPVRIGEPMFVKINLKMSKSHLPKEENLEFIGFSRIDGFPIFKLWGDFRYLSNIYPVEELAQTKF